MVCCSPGSSPNPHFEGREDPGNPDNNTKRAAEEEYENIRPPSPTAHSQVAPFRAWQLTIAPFSIASAPPPSLKTKAGGYFFYCLINFSHPGGLLKCTSASRSVWESLSYFLPVFTDSSITVNTPK